MGAAARVKPVYLAHIGTAITRGNEPLSLALSPPRTARELATLMGAVSKCDPVYLAWKGLAGRLGCFGR